MHPSELPPELTDRKFEIVVRRLADDLRYGQDGSRFVGPGVDYAQSRPFVDGDPVRDIDWRVTARTGKYHVKEYETLKTTPIYLLVDTSASMACSSRPFNKHLLATTIAGGLGLAALRRLSPVGLLSIGERQLQQTPSLSRAALFQGLHQLRHFGFDEGTHVARRIDQLSGILRSHTLVVVLSDLHAPDATSAIKRLAQRHDCIVLHVEDPVENGRLRAGVFRGVEAETGHAFVAHGRTRWFDGVREQPSDVLRSAGIDYLHLPTDRPFVAPLRRFLAARGGSVRNTR